MVFDFEISSNTWIIVGLWLLVTILHALSLRRIIPWSFRAHLWALGFLWLIVIIISPLYLLFSLSIGRGYFPALGIATLLLGGGIVVWHSRILGWKRLMGQRFFESCPADRWITTGLYRYLTNPIYDGLAVVFFGFFLWRGNIDFLLLATVSLLFLNVFLARIENIASAAG